MPLTPQRAMTQPRPSKRLQIMTDILSDTGPLARLPWRPIVWGGAAALYAVPVVAWFAVDGMLISTASAVSNMSNVS